MLFTSVHQKVSLVKLFFTQTTAHITAYLRNFSISRYYTFSTTFHVLECHWTCWK